MKIYNIRGCGQSATEKLEEYKIEKRDSGERVVDDSNFLPMSRADAGRIGKPAYDFTDGKDTGDRTRLRLANKSLDITETDELLKDMEQDIKYAQRKEQSEAQKKALEEKQNAINEALAQSLGVDNNNKEAKEN